MKAVPFSLPIVAMIAALLSACATSPEFDLANEAELRGDIAWLADDARLGREPGGPAEGAIRDYATRRMQAIGLAPAFAAAPDGRRWTQPVVMVHRTPISAGARFQRRHRDIALGTDQFEYSGETAQSSLDDAPLLFLGEMPPQAIAKRSLSGTLVMMLQPGSSALQADRVAAARAAGASGMITIVDSPARFDRIAQRMREPHFFLPGGKALGRIGEEREFYTGVMTEQAAVRLASGSGLDWDSLRRNGRDEGYDGIRFGVTLDLDWRASIEERRSANIAGVSRGTKPGSGAVLFMAHWDHLGLCARDAAGSLVICPGAIDNASGVAALWQVAERLGDERHDRDIYFLLTSGEEEGFVGAHSFIAVPPAPLSDFVGIFNLDMLAIGPGGASVAVVGWRNDAVDGHIETVLAQLGLRRSQSDAQKEYLKRQDGWAFIERGLPARMVNSAFGNDRQLADFIASGYHQPSDRYAATMEMGAAAQDIALHIALGRYFANEDSVPNE